MTELSWRESEQKRTIVLVLLRYEKTKALRARLAPRRVPAAVLAAVEPSALLPVARFDPFLAPLMVDLAVTSPIFENETATLSGSIVDPGAVDSFTVETADVPVIIQCASDRTLVVDESDNLAEVPDLTGEVLAEDNCSVSITQIPAAGTRVSAGDHPVTITATVPGGNAASCSANLRVLNLALSSVEKIKAHFHQKPDGYEDADCNDSADGDPRCFSKIQVDGELRLRDVALLPVDVRAQGAGTVEARVVLNLAGSTITDESVVQDVKDHAKEKWEAKRPGNAPKVGLHSLKIDWKERAAYDSHQNTGLGSDVPRIVTKFIGSDETDLELRFKDVPRPFTIVFADPAGGSFAVTIEDDRGTVTVVPAGDYDLKSKKDELNIELPFRLTPQTAISFTTAGGVTETPIPVEPDVNYDLAGGKYMLKLNRTDLSEALCQSGELNSLSEQRLVLELHLDSGLREVVAFVAIDPADWTRVDNKHWKLKP